MRRLKRSEWLTPAQYREQGFLRRRERCGNCGHVRINEKDARDHKLEPNGRCAFLRCDCEDYAPMFAEIIG